jgi:hypothetical protein
MKHGIDHNFSIGFNPPRLTYETGRDKQEIVIGNPFTIRARDPVIALNRFHRMMQREFGISHRYYHVNKLEKVYNDGADNKGKEIRSAFDLPDSRTPDVTKKKRQKVETATMPFYDETLHTLDVPDNAFDTR